MFYSSPMLVVTLFPASIFVSTALEQFFDEVQPKLCTAAWFYFKEELEVACNIFANHSLVPCVCAMELFPQQSD
jgi:hypothetical protein